MKMLIILLILLLIALIADAAPASKRTGVASWYVDSNDNVWTASGEVFNPGALTCASYEYPLGTRLRVTDPQSKRSVVVQVNDLGPAKRLGRLVDLTPAAFKRLAPLSKGLVLVDVEKL